MNRGDVPRRLDQQPSEAPIKSSQEAGNGRIGTTGQLQEMGVEHRDLGRQQGRWRRGDSLLDGGARGEGRRWR